MKLPTNKNLYDYYNDDKQYSWTSRAISGKLEPYDLARLNAVDRTLKDLNLSKAKVIDVGCGSGIFSNLAASMNYQVLGMDISHNAVKVLNKRYKKNKNLKFLQATAEKIPARSKSADLILCFEVLEHLVNPSVSLSEIHRVLKDNGLAIISVPNWFNLDRLGSLAFTKRAFLTIKGKLSNQNISPHLQFNSPYEWQTIFRKSGFRTIKSRPVYIFPPIPFFRGLLGFPKRMENFIMINLKGIKVQQYFEGLIYNTETFRDFGQSHLWVLKKTKRSL